MQADEQGPLGSHELRAMGCPHLVHYRNSGDSPILEREGQWQSLRQTSKGWEWENEDRDDEVLLPMRVCSLRACGPLKLTVVCVHMRPWRRLLGMRFWVREEGCVGSWRVQLCEDSYLAVSPDSDGAGGEEPQCLLPFAVLDVLVWGQDQRGEKARGLFRVEVAGCVPSERMLPAGLLASSPDLCRSAHRARALVQLFGEGAFAEGDSQWRLGTAVEHQILPAAGLTLVELENRKLNLAEHPEWMPLLQRALAHVPELHVVAADQEVPAAACARFFLLCEQVPHETVTVGLRKLLGSRAFQRQHCPDIPFRACKEWRVEVLSALHARFTPVLLDAEGMRLLMARPSGEFPARQLVKEQVRHFWPQVMGFQGPLVALFGRRQGLAVVVVLPQDLLRVSLTSDGVSVVAVPVAEEQEPWDGVGEEIVLGAEHMQALVGAKRARRRVRGEGEEEEEGEEAAGEHDMGGSDRAGGSPVPRKRAKVVAQEEEEEEEARGGEEEENEEEEEEEEREEQEEGAKGREEGAMECDSVCPTGEERLLPVDEEMGRRVQQLEADHREDRAVIAGLEKHVGTLENRVEELETMLKSLRQALV